MRHPRAERGDQLLLLRDRALPVGALQLGGTEPLLQGHDPVPGLSMKGGALPHHALHRFRERCPRIDALVRSVPAQQPIGALQEPAGIDDHRLVEADANRRKGREPDEARDDAHCLVVTKRHAATIFEADPVDLGAAMAAAKRIALAIDKALRPDGLNLLQANGAAAFQSVPHFHLHLIPRWANDGKGFDWKLVPGNREAIMKTGERIRAALS